MLSEQELELIERTIKFYENRNISSRVIESAALARAWMQLPWELRNTSWAELEESFEIGKAWQNSPLRDKSIRDIDYNEDTVEILKEYPLLNRKTLRELERHLEQFTAWETSRELNGKGPQEVEAALSCLEDLTEGLVHQDVPKASLLFDGECLYWQQDGNNASWPAYSGKEPFWKNKRFSKEDQRIRNEGPIPEGWYRVPQAEYQNISYSGLHETVALYGVIVHRITGWGPCTKWPGSFVSWGHQRIWIHPEPATNTFGRDGFSIHGGLFPGSAGCIDLLENMSEFMEYFLFYCKDMELEVFYRK